MRLNGNGKTPRGGREGRMKYEKCDCEVQQLLDDAKKDWHWAKCIRWNSTTWHLYCPVHHVYVAIEDADAGVRGA